MLTNSEGVGVRLLEGHRKAGPRLGKHFVVQVTNRSWQQKSHPKTNYLNSFSFPPFQFCMLVQFRNNSILPVPACRDVTQVLSRVLMAHWCRSSCSKAGTWAGWVKGMPSMTVALWAGTSHAAPGRTQVWVTPPGRGWPEQQCLFCLFHTSKYGANQRLA